MKNRLAEIAVACEYMSERLGLPRGSAICGATFDFQRQVVKLLMHHESFPEVDCDGPYPEMIVEITRYDARYVKP